MQWVIWGIADSSDDDDLAADTSDAELDMDHNLIDHYAANGNDNAQLTIESTSETSLGGEDDGDDANTNNDKGGHGDAEINLEVEYYEEDHEGDEGGDDDYGDDDEIESKLSPFDQALIQALRTLLYPPPPPSTLAQHFLSPRSSSDSKSGGEHHHHKSTEIRACW